MPIFPSFSPSSSLERKKEKRFADIRKQTEDSFSLVGRRRSEWIYTSCVFTNLYKVFTSLLLVAFVACVLHFANFPRVLWGERTKTATATEIQLFTREVVNARLFSGFSLYFFSFFPSQLTIVNGDVFMNRGRIWGRIWWNGLWWEGAEIGIRN